MQVFSKRKRTDDSPPGFAESTYDFLDRSSDAMAAEVRSVIEDWFGRLPVGVRGDYRSRLRGRVDGFWGAYWELLLHEVLRRMDGVEVDVAPSVGELTPDFRITTPSGSAYVEAKVFVEPDRDGRSQARRAPILDALSNVWTTDVWLDVQFETEGEKTPPLTPLLGQVQAWVDELDADRLLAAVGSKPDGLPPSVANAFVAGQWRIRVRALPRSPDRRERLQGFHIGPAWGRQVDDHRAIRKALIKKARRYRKTLDHPLIPAVYNSRWTAADHETALALYGPAWEHPAMMKSMRLPSSWRNTPEGLWITRTGTKHKEIGAVLVGHRAGPYGLALSELTLWNPPWAGSTLLDSRHIGRRSPDREGNLVAVEAEYPLWMLLGLSTDWPG